MRTEDEYMEEMLERFRQLADRVAEWKPKREYLDEYKKSMLALLMKEAEKAGVTSAAGQERDARARGEYLKLLTEIEAAMKEEVKAIYHLKAVEIEIEVWRTKSANARSERRAYGA